MGSLAVFRISAYKRGVDTAHSELAHLIERLHRRYLDLIRAELNRQGVRDINAVQALLLTNIGEDEIVTRDLIERGYYQGSNVSYNMKKLVEAGYIEQTRSARDKRAVIIKLTDKAQAICGKLAELDAKNSEKFAQRAGGDDDIAAVRDTLQELERIWSDYINYGR